MRLDSAKMLVSIVIPVYNAAKYLAETLESLLAQEFSDYELICVNDKSTDNSLEILEKYQKQFSGKMRIINNRENVGPGEARNIGLRSAQGKYLAFFDADDVYFPKMLKKMVNVADNGNCEIVVVGCEFYYQKHDRAVAVSHTIRRDLLPEAKIFAVSDVTHDVFELFKGWTWDKIFLREFIEENQLEFQDLRSSDDACFTFMAIVKAKRIAVVDEGLVKHRILDSGSVSTSRDESWDCFYLALIKMRERLQVWNLYSQLERDFINYALSFSLWHLVTLSGAAYFACYQKLKEWWWEELGVAGKAADYFYNQGEYELYAAIQEKDATEFLFFYRAKLEEAMEIATWQIDELSELNKEKDLRLEKHELEIEKRVEELSERERALALQVEGLNQELAMVRASRAYKLGRKIMWLPHFVKTKIFRKK